MLGPLSITGFITDSLQGKATVLGAVLGSDPFPMFVLNGGKNNLFAHYADLLSNTPTSVC